MFPRQHPRRLLPLLSRAQLFRPALASGHAMKFSVETTLAKELPQPRKFPSTGFDVVDHAQKLEEERLPFYVRDEYYPMKIGDVVHDHYQVVAKLGYGTSATVWLSRDLRDGKYWALKVYINTLQYNQELIVYKHLANAPSNNANELGFENVRQLNESFKISGPDGDHDVLVMTPLGMSLKTFQEMQSDGVFPRELVTGALDQVLLGLNLLHEAGVVHTDFHADNLLIALANDSILTKVEQNEIDKPSPRKQIGDRIIYVSQYMLGGAGELVISDFGQARIGLGHDGNAMPLAYRAPEVILGMPWGPPVDAWSAGLLTWDLLERENLFEIYDSKSQEHNDACHLAAMTALLGPPPREFLEKSPATRKYWDENGQWAGLVPLPVERTFESLAATLEEDDKEMFLNFIQCYVRWLPKERLKPIQGYMHPFLRGGELPDSFD